jgi:hypothetical protein
MKEATDMTGGHGSMRRAVRPLAVLALATGMLVLPALGTSAMAASPPSVATGGVSDTTFSTVNLFASVNAAGQATNYVFQYGTTSGYGAQTPLAPAGNGTITIKVSRTLAGLQPATIYHYRILAVNASGTTFGKDRTFSTKRVPLSVQLVGAPNPVVFGDPFFVEGNLSGTGAANHEIALQANPFPYLGGFKTVGNIEVTNATGGFSFPFLGLLENAQLRVVTVGSPVVISPVVVESVAVRVTFHARSVRHRRGYVRLYGTVTPSEVGALVGFQLLQPGNKSINEGGTVVKAGSATVSSFSRTVRVRHPGLYRALIKVANDGAHVSNYSPPILVR